MKKVIAGILVLLLCLLGLGLGFSPSVAALPPSIHSWTDLSHAIANLPTRYGHALAYDASAGKVILFGGFSGSDRLNDTWAYDYGGSWTNLNPANPPPVRSSHALAYDASAGKVILFGGYGFDGSLGDTWAYDYASNSWTNLNPANTPSVRDAHAMAYDASAGKVILFGGYGFDGSLNDTWAYDYASNNWTNLNPANPPSTRHAHALAYDASAGKVILFGGTNSADLLNDTWAYDYATNSWTNRNPSNPPSARDTHALTYDASAGKVILFGGYNYDSGNLNDTWAYDYAANSWTNRNPSNPPSARYGHTLAYDTAAGKVILFGGTNSLDLLNDTCAYDYAAHNWTNLSQATAAPARYDHALAYNASAGKVILFGGYGFDGSLNDTWAYDYGGSWTNLSPANPPPVRSSRALAYDASAGKVILFGGTNDVDLLGDTWAYDYATNNWTNRNPTNPPPARDTHALAYDASAGKVILFGGWNNGVLNDTWAYDYATNSWTNRNPINPPPVRSSHTLAYDASIGKVILFGGTNDVDLLGDTWAYDYATNSWTNRNPANPPSTRFAHAMAYDDAAGKVILFGGWGSNDRLNDTWAYGSAANSWSQVSTSPTPPARYGHAMACDASAGKVILFGGYNSGSDYFNDTWALTMGEGASLVLHFFIGDPTYFVNTTPKTMDTAPVIVESRTFLPIRYVAEELGAEVNWYPDESKVEILHKGNQLWLWLGQRLAGMNGELMPIDPDNPNVVPFIQPPGRTMMPLRFISENLGCKVDWLPPGEVQVTYPAP